MRNGKGGAEKIAESESRKLEAERARAFELIASIERISK